MKESVFASDFVNFCSTCPDTEDTCLNNAVCRHIYHATVNERDALLELVENIYLKAHNMVEVGRMIRKSKVLPEGWNNVQ